MILFLSGSGSDQRDTRSLVTLALRLIYPSSTLPLSPLSHADRQTDTWTGNRQDRTQRTRRPVDHHGGLILTGQVAEGDVGDLVDDLFPQRIV